MLACRSLRLMKCRASVCFFFFNDTATTEIYTLSLHDALPISKRHVCETRGAFEGSRGAWAQGCANGPRTSDPRPTLNSSRGSRLLAALPRCLPKGSAAAPLLTVLDGHRQPTFAKHL